MSRTFDKNDRNVPRHQSCRTAIYCAWKRKTDAGARHVETENGEKGGVKKRLNILLSGCFYSGSYNGSFISELPLPLPATGNSVYLQNIYLTSLDNYNSQQNFLALGYDGSNQQRITYYTQPLSTAPLCATPQTIPTSDADYGAKTHYCPYAVCSGVFDCSKTPQASELSIPLEIICEQP